MSRNRYTPLVRKRERAQVARKEKELATLAKKFKLQDEEAAQIPVINNEKVRRSARVEQKRRHKARRRQKADQNQS